MQFPLVIKISLFFVLILLGACQVKEANPFEEARNPYAQFGVEGFIGVTMTACLGKPPSGPPIRKNKNKGTVFNEGSPTEKADYFDCIDKEIIKVERKKLNNKTN